MPARPDPRRSIVAGSGTAVAVMLSTPKVATIRGMPTPGPPNAAAGLWNRRSSVEFVRAQSLT